MGPQECNFEFDPNLKSASEPTPIMDLLQTMSWSSQAKLQALLLFIFIFLCPCGCCVLCMLLITNRRKHHDTREMSAIDENPSYSSLNGSFPKGRVIDAKPVGTRSLNSAEDPRIAFEEEPRPGSFMSCCSRSSGPRRSAHSALMSSDAPSQSIR